MEIKEKVLGFINDLVVALQSAKLYSTTHKKFEESVIKTHKDLKEILDERGTLVIGIIGDDFVFENEIFFDYSATTIAQAVINSLKQDGIEKIIFHSRISWDELNSFIVFLSSVQGKGVKVDQDHLVRLNIENVMIDQITAPISEYEAQKKEEVVTFNFYKSYLNKAAEYVTAVLEGREIDYLAIRLNITNIMDNLADMKRFLSWAPVQIRALTPIVHTVNVSVLAMDLACKLGFTKDEITDLAIAALFHDIGRFYLVNRREEAAGPRRHGEIGSRILLKYVKVLGLLPVLVCFDHHLRHDLKGSGGLIFKYKPHVASSIISICDAYDSLSQRRSQKYDYPPDVIYKLMMKGGGNFFSLDLLEMFFKIIGIWPVGTIVALSDGSIGAVYKENENDIDRPKVKITEYVTSKIIDLKGNEGLSIAKALNPFTEGKAYQHLV